MPKSSVLSATAIYKESRATYGSPRVWAKLRQQGMKVGQNRVARLLKQAGICVKKRRRFVRTTDSKHGFPVAQNLLTQQFQMKQKTSVGE